jgi:hypothetical protein
MSYTTQAIVCLANDLAETANAIHAKREAAGDATGLVNSRNIDRSIVVIGSPHQLAAQYRYSNSRLYIVGHGNPESTHIMGTTSGRRIQWDAVQLAEKIFSWLGDSIIARISLHMCFGGGNRSRIRGSATRGSTESLESYLSRFEVDPRNSFAYKLARHCCLGRTITARTDVVAGTTTSRNGTIIDFSRTVGGHTTGAYDKATFTTVNGARPTNPIDPSVSIQTS